MMEKQIDLFTNEFNGAKDIRTKGQESNLVAFDVGEKIEGSRKEEAALRQQFEENMSISNLQLVEDANPIVAAELVTRKAMFSGFALENEKENGTEVMIAKVKDLIIKRIDKHPKDCPSERETYAEAANYIMDSFRKICTWSEFQSMYKEVRQKLLYERQDPSFAKQRLEETRLELDKYEPETERYDRALKSYYSYQDMISHIEDARRIPLEVLGDKFTNFFLKVKSCNTTLKNIQSNISSWDDLLEPSKSDKTSPLTRQHVWSRQLPDRPGRIGGEVVHIEKPNDIVDLLGFRGVEFGHWVNDQEALDHITKCTEAFLDLRDILKMDHNYSITFNGDLGIGFGSRGRGKANGHYDLRNRIINLTKKRGLLGIVAHEWFHGLDHYLYNVSHSHKSGHLQLLSNHEGIGSNLSPQVVKRSKELMDAILNGTSIEMLPNKNTDTSKWRIGISLSSLYKKTNADLYECMRTKAEEMKRTMDNHKSLYGHYISEKDALRLENKYKRDIRKTAQALAWLHEEKTGERVNFIPVPSDRSEYYQQSISLDKGKVGKYWSSQTELAARAFEAYVSDKLKEKNLSNDYLVSGTEDGRAFPVGEERVKINSHFEQFFDELRKVQLV